MNQPVTYFVGVDVGTGSVRAALVSEYGNIISTSNKTTKTWSVQPDFFEQSSEDIWNAVVKCVKVFTSYIEHFHIFEICDYYRSC